MVKASKPWEGKGWDGRVIAQSENSKGELTALVRSLVET